MALAPKSLSLYTYSLTDSCEAPSKNNGEKEGFSIRILLQVLTVLNPSTSDKVTIKNLAE